jgi:exodeoxyribonuclease-3
VKLISWNVNGLRAVIRSGSFAAAEAMDADIFCLQETRAGDGAIQVDLPGYQQYWNNAGKKGYSGTAVFTRVEPLAVSFGMDIPEHDREGRLITLELPDFFLVNVYTPNSQRGLTRLGYRMQWDRDFLAYIKKLEQTRPVVFCGDLNVAHKEIDLKNPKSNVNNPGFTKEERSSFDRIIESGFVDTFRVFNKEPGNYTWWSYRFNARAKGIGWRIDYFCISSSLQDSLKDAFILDHVAGSDHCPVGIVMENS